MGGRRRELAVVAVLLIAGCSGFAADRDPQVGVTPAPVPRTATPVPVVSAEGVRNPAALADAHASVLNTSYTLRIAQTTRDEHGTFVARRELSARVGENGSFHVVLSVAGPLVTDLIGAPQARTEFWSDGDGLLRVYAVGNRTRYDASAPSHDPAMVLSGSLEHWITRILIGRPPREDVYRLFSAVDVRVGDGTGVDRDGRRQYHVESTGATNATKVSRIVGIGSPESMDLRAVVDERGLVRSYRLEYTTRRGSDTLRSVRTVRYVAIGTTDVHRPPWYDEATANATEG